eukprot:CAMPEP_0172903792 /NCGR_PEP_ID=MMETSP1075-20121228/171317_1 /TAXON_ID=2916 /ORGANISM="Ceratium fusus, Strain PA161109" /LENGTH=557 /DNA_ID=CAMNT_0013760711 /DNA_START=26 /DNA_END=1696 /DNA_ORIENTATION=+
MSWARESQGYKQLDAAEACNGSPKLCHLPLNRVTLAGHHNAEAYHLMYNNVRVACAIDYHKHDIVGALQKGLRFFDLDTGMMNASGGSSGDLIIRNCHGRAVGRTLVEILRDLRLWLQVPTNRREVVSLSFNEAIPVDNSQQQKEAMLLAMLPLVEEQLSNYMLRPGDRPLDGGWPTLGWMVESNKRVLVLWGSVLWSTMNELDQKDPARNFRGRHFGLEDDWSSTWRGKYGTWSVEELKGYLVTYCEKSASKQQLIVAEAYLANLNRGQAAQQRCNDGLAAEVNPEMLADDHPAESPLLEMQRRCWAKQRHISFVVMDFSEQYGNHLESVAFYMNEQNFVRYGWVGGVAVLGKTLFGRITSGPLNTASVLDGDRQRTEELSEDEFHRLLVALADGGLDEERLSIDSVQHSTTRTKVFFSISAPKDHDLDSWPNQDILAKMKAQVVEGLQGGIHVILSDCGDPGHPKDGLREPDPTWGFLEGAVVSFSCQFGFELQGDSRRSCGPDGIYTGVQPTCWLEGGQLWDHVDVWVKVMAGLSIVALIACCALTVHALRGNG